MPHIIVEYTDNIAGQAGIGELLRKINQVLIDQGGIFPIGGIRSRAIRLSEYCVADGACPDDAFVHVTLRIAAGREEEARERACSALFEMMKAHFAEIYASRPFALSLETAELPPTFKHNNIHQRYRKG